MARHPPTPRETIPGSTQDDPVPETNNDPGAAAVPSIAGVPITGLIAAADGWARVQLADGSKAVIPATEPMYAVAVAIAPVIAPPPVPGSVSNAQARAALRAAGLLATVEATIAGLADPVITDAWEYAPYLNRDSTLVASLGAARGLTSQQVDDLFIAAGSVVF